MTTFYERPSEVQRGVYRGSDGDDTILLSIFSLIYYLINSLFMIIFIDKIERYIRLNMGFEETKGEFERLEKEYFDSFNPDEDDVVV